MRTGRPTMATRRRVLVAAAAVVFGVSGCGPLRIANGRTSRLPSASASGLTLAMPPIVPAQSAQQTLSQQYHALRPDVTVTWTGWNGGRVDKWAVFPLIGAGGVVGPGLDVVDLGPALRARNAEAPSFLPGALESFTVAGSVSALPLTLSPQGIRYNPAAFASLGVSPSPDWTMGDFEKACATVKAALAAGKLQGVSGVLPLLMGIWCPGRPGTARTCIQGLLEASTNWLPIVQGLGGWVYRDGSFDLTNTGAVEAFFTMIDWHRRYGAPSGISFDDTKEMFQFVQSSAMGFWPDGTPGPAATAKFAPFFGMPHASPIGVRVTGIGIATQTAANIFPPDEQISAFVDFMLWLYRPEQQRLMAGSGVAPMINDAALQDGFWTNGYRYPGVVPPGGWRRFAPTDLGLPVGAPLDKVVSPVFAKYADPQADVHGLQADLQAVTNSLSEWVRQHPSNEVVGA